MAGAPAALRERRAPGRLDLTRAPAAALAALLLLAGCDISGPRLGPPTELAAGALPDSLHVGQAIEVTATVRDAVGRALGGASVGWTTAHGSVSAATTAADVDGAARTTWTLGTVAGSQSLTVHAGDLQLVLTAAVHAGPAATLVVAPGEATLESIGDTLVLTATVQDAYGNGIDPGAVGWSSSAPSVVSVEGGVVVSVAAGSASVRAVLGPLSDSAAVVVAQVATALAIIPAEPIMVTDETLQLAAALVDARGQPLPGGVHVDWWESSAPAVAAVDTEGSITAGTPGTAVVTASHDAWTATATVDVRAGPRPTITAITPSVLAAGDTAVLTGLGFSAQAGENEVTVGGHAAPVVSATGTELRAVVPAPAVPCAPASLAEVVVTADRLSGDPFQHMLATAPPVALAPGESVALFADGAPACNEITEPGHYLLSVFNASTAASSVTGFRLRGTGQTAAAAAARADDLAATRRMDGGAPAGSAPVPDPGEAMHLRILEENRSLGEELLRRTRTDGPAILPMQVAAAPAVGDTRSFRIPNLDANPFAFCTNYHEVTARAVHVGPKGVIWEDTAAPLAGTIDTAWIRLGQEVDDVIYPIVDHYFGDPLVHNDHLGGDGRVALLFSPRINQLTANVAAFVVTGDFFPRALCESSDETEIFYAGVPTVAGPGYDDGSDLRNRTTSSFLWATRSTIIHELKHVAAFARKIHDAGLTANLEEVWLEEATARLAEEFYARALFGYGQGDRVTYDESIWCEIRFGEAWPACDPYPVVMWKHFHGLHTYLREIEQRTPLGSAGAGDASFYGSGWLLVRWAMDHSGLPEAEFSKAIVADTQLRGTANLAARAGRAFPALLADFTLALAADGYPGAALPLRPELTYPGWDVRDIYRGLHQDNASAFEPWPLASRALTGGTFLQNVMSVRAGSAAIFDLSGVAGPQLLELLSATGGTAPASLGLSILRIQ